jgi:predicted branched-subunit amino acid permease
MSTRSARSEFFAGVKAELPISAVQAQAMSVIVFAGSAQFIMAQLFALGTPASIIVVTAILVNLRHALYSASVAPYVNHLPDRWRLGLAYLLTDEAYAVAINHYIFLGAQIPASWPLDFFLALTFIALVIPALEDWAAAAAALTAGLVSILAFNLPFKLGLVAAALVGIAAGMLVEEAVSRQPSADSGKPSAFSFQSSVEQPPAKGHEPSAVSDRSPATSDQPPTPGQPSDEDQL